MQRNSNQNDHRGNPHPKLPKAEEKTRGDADNFRTVSPLERFRNQEDEEKKKKKYNSKK